MNYLMTRSVRLVLFILILFNFTGISIAQEPELASEQAQEEEVEIIFSTTVSELKARSLSQKGKAIEQLAQFDNPRKIHILNALAKGKLYEVRADGRVVIAKNKSQNIILYWLKMAWKSVV